ncbi:synaptonemal complex protein 2-like isoform X2 [Larus michahellis]|uniref:synaptonemal complex protein 2-like isoform X2 n=1 Tax=Larus michahellis TaxID=119627 RepID=UPI003D9B1883
MDQEGRSEDRNKGMNNNMGAIAEDYLESLLTDAFKGKGFQKISNLLQEREIEPPQKYSESLFNQLDRALRKELDKNEFQNVSLLLKCVQVYFKTDLQEGTSLFIEQGLVEKLVSWFERTRAFLILIDPDENKFLMLLLEDFFDSALVICKCSNEGKKELVNLFLPELGHLVTEENICCALRQEALRTLNSILNSVPREERKKFPLSEEMCSLTKDLAKTILEAGDYDLQVALSEALCRLMTKKWRDDLVHHWFEDNYLAEAFKEIKDREFETDCRKFLNRLNERLGDERRVYSFPCISAFADMNEMKKPSDEKLEEFWIDFNTGTQSVTFYVDSNEGALWESVRLSKEAVSSYSLKEEDGQNIVKIYMKIPAILNKTEATKIKISFSAKFEIFSVVRKVLGDEKMMINLTEEESVHAGKQTRQNEAVVPESTNPEGGKDPSNSENMDSISDSLTSQQSQQLTGTVPKMVNSGVAMITVSQQTDVEDANQGSAKKTKTLSPRMKTKPSEKPLEEEPMEELTSVTPKKNVTWEKKNRKTSLAKQRTEGRKDFYDFENSDSASHEKVAEAKGKILGQKVSSQNQRSYETGNKNEESNMLKRSLSSYRKHLFSESNNENTSTGQSEKSWILDPQKRSLPKSLDYTRKRPRVRSKLKVLPMSSASSGSDYETKKETSRQRAQKETLRKKSKSSSKGDNLPTVDLADETLSEELKGGPLSLDASAKGYSSDEEKATQKFLDASGKLSGEEESFKRKDSGQKMDDSVTDAFFSKMLHEDFSDSGVITAFESFISQLKKLLWSRYKRMETSAQNTLRTSEKNVSTLLNQIHECRLSKLETFQKIVVEELASLEKEIQILANMEKDVVDFWNEQLLKLSSFCNQQKERQTSQAHFPSRIQSVDSALGETAKSFATTIRNTTYEQSMKKTVENNVFIVPSD